MSKKYLDADGLLYFWQKIKNTFALSSDVPTKTSDLTNDSGFITSADVPEGSTASSTTPKMDGTATVGTETAFARGDHIHPHDTSKADKTSTVTNVSYDTTNKKLRKTINSSVTDIVTVATLKTDMALVKGDVGLGNVDNTSDADKPISTATQTALNGKVNTSAVGSASGVCPLNSSSKIDTTYLPSYVDDVIEAYARSGQTALSASWLSATSGGSALTPETGKIYVLMADSGNYTANSQFRWGGSAYVKLADGGVSSITNSEIDTIVAS